MEAQNVSEHNMNWNELRTHFPITQEYVFLNHAAVSPLPDMSIKAVCDYVQSAGAQGSEAIPRWVKVQENVRRNLAQLIGARPNEIAFVDSTSEGISIVANGLNWKEGDNVVIPDVEFPSNVYPWLNLERRGVKVHWWRAVNGRLSLDDLRKLLDSRTRLVSVSAVQYGNGFRVDLSGLSGMLKKKNVLLCVDSIQQVGAIPLDAKALGVDFLAADGHKWLLSMEGLGFFFCDENLLDRLYPATVGWKSVVDALEFHRIDFTLRPDAARFEPGSLNTAGIYGLAASVELLSGIGIALIFKKICSLIDELAEGLVGRGLRILSWLGEKERSGILVFTTGEKDKEVYEHLRRNKIITSLRGGGIRLSPHFYNNEEDVRRFFEVLDKTSH
jgi:selenocysteine lyase/cysteine desulfurase